MAKCMKQLFDIGSSESETEGSELSPNNQTIKPKIKELCELFEKVGLESARATHHLKMAKEAIKSGVPPKGLTPNLTLTAYMETEELKAAVKSEMTQAGLAICKLLRNHYLAIHKKNVDKLNEIEKICADLTNAIEDPECKTAIKEWTLKTLNASADRCEAEGKRLAERVSKKRTRDDAPTEEAPATKKAKVGSAPLS